MIPPAVRIQRTSRSPARASVAAELLRAGEALHRARQVGVGVAVAGDAPEQRHDAVEPERKNVDSGGFVGVVISSTTTRPPGRTTRAISRRPALEVGEVARAEADRRGVERVVRVGQLERVAPLDSSPARRPPCAARQLEHLLREVRADDLAAGPTRRASSSARSPVPVATSSTRPPGPTAARSAARARQRWCSPAVMTEFMTVVDAGDAVEHRPHLRLLEGARVRGGGAHAPPLAVAGAT